MTAPIAFGEPMTGDWFYAYSEQALARTLTPGDVVILDYLPAPQPEAAIAVDELWAAIAKAVEIFTPAERANMLATAGCGST